MFSWQQSGAVDASCWVNNPRVRGSKPRSAILIFIILLLLFIFVRMICLFRVSRYHFMICTHLFLSVFYSLSLLAFGLALKMRATSYTRIIVSQGSGLKFPCLPRSSQKLITEIINLADKLIMKQKSCQVWVVFVVLDISFVSPRPVGKNWL